MDIYDPNYRPAPKQGMGCFAKGCITLLVVGFIIFALVGFFSYQAYRSIASYIADHPSNVQVYPATDEDYAAVMEKVEPFVTAMSNGKAETLELTARDINVLIAKEPKFDGVRGRLAVSIDRDEITADISAPIDEDKARGRAAKHYFNGRLKTGLTVNDGEFEVLPHAVEVNGKPVPGWAMQIVQNKDFRENFTKSFNDGLREDPKSRAFLSKLRSVRVVGDHLVITSVGEPAVAPTPAPP